MKIKEIFNNINPCEKRLYKPYIIAAVSYTHLTLPTIA
jgi:hypothetical protein